MMDDLNSKLESAQHQESILKSEKENLLKKQEKLEQNLESLEKCRAQIQVDLEQEKSRSASELADISDQLSAVKSEVQEKISQAENQVEQLDLDFSGVRIIYKGYLNIRYKNFIWTLTLIRPLVIGFE